MGDITELHPVDYQHLMSCVDKDCWYCNDRQPDPQPGPPTDWLALLYDLGASLPPNHPFSQAA